MLAWLLHLAFVASVLAVVAGALHVRGRGQARAWSHGLMVAATALSLLSFMVLMVLFVRVETAYQYVFLYTSTDVPLRYRIAGTWAGREGSMLMWSTFAGLVAVAFAWWNRRRYGAAGASGAVAESGSEAAADGSGAPGAAAGAAAPGQAASGPPHGLHGLAGTIGVDGVDGAAGPPPAASQSGSPDAARRADAGLGRSVAWTELVLAVITAAFMGAVAFQGTFAATDGFLLRNRPGGNGLNPTLLNPFILIHPPLMFAAYALTAVPLAAVVADQITGSQAWSRIGMMWSRIDWLLYTAAMGLGGIWAYYTLGFGGYWAWDPVEVANLLPWLALTLFLHAQLHHRRYGRYAHLGPLLGILPFLLTLFSTISTRSGLWVSVHAFTDPTGTFDPDGPSRMLQILARDPGLQFHVGLFLAVLAAFLALWARRIAHDTGLLARTQRIVAGVLGAVAVASALAPHAVLGLLLEAAVTIVPGRPGFGLLALTALAVLAPAIPLFMLNEPAGKQRLDLRLLNVVALAVLGTGLLVLFMWHMAAVNGWSSSVYHGRYPIIATPAILGLIVFQAHALWRRQAVWIALGALVFAGLLATQYGIPGFLLLLSTVLVLLSLYRVAQVQGVSPRIQMARGALWIGAVLNVLFWLNPPTIRLGFTWQPMWPTQLFMGALAFVALHLATELLAGRTRRTRAAHLLVGLLGAYYVAPVLAALSWYRHRGADVLASTSRRPLHRVGLYGIHLAVAIALLGYTTSTYLAHHDTQDLAPMQTLRLGTTEATLLEIHQEGRPRIDRILPLMQVDGSTATAILYWEPQASSHYPLPATARLWDRDVYFAIDAVCIDPAGECEDARDWVPAYEAGAQLPAGIPITQVRLQAFDLPGIALVWGALALWLYFMGLVMAYGPERP